MCKLLEVAMILYSWAEAFICPLEICCGPCPCEMAWAATVQHPIYMSMCGRLVTARFERGISDHKIQSLWL